MATSCISILTSNESLYPRDKISNWLKTFPVLYGDGNLSLLQLPLTAIFCSRKCPGDAILKAYDMAKELREKETPVISGFHTPVEKDMLEILLKGKGPIVICPARGLEGMRIAPALREGVNHGRILFLSIAPPQEKRITEEFAIERNRLVSALASEHIFIFVEPGGQLSQLRRDITVG